jgi:flagellar motor switch protein FliN/FliY
MTTQQQSNSSESNGASVPPSEVIVTAAAEPAPAQSAAVPETLANSAVEALEFGVLRKVPMNVQVEVGRTIMTLGQILDDLEVGTSIRLDRHAGDPVEVYVNGTLFARAEVVVVQDQIGAKIVELVDSGRALRPSRLR